MRPAAAPSPSFQPLAQINITPLIDVMLVLLIMLILTIPATTHKVPIDLPAAGPGTSPVETHLLRIAQDGTLSWDGAAIEEAALPPRLAALAAQDKATLQLETASDARYARFDQILADVKRAGITRLGFVGNDAFRKF